MTSIDLPKLSVRSIPDLIAAVPYLLGFHPADSVVVVACRGKRLVFAARADLPPVDALAGFREAHAARFAAVVKRQGVDTLALVGYGPSDRVTPTIDAMRVALERMGLPVVEALRITDGRYWSYTCANPGCCPPDGTPFDAAATQVAAEATFAGHVALPDRETLARQIAPLDGPVRVSMRQATARAEQRLAKLLDTASPASPTPPVRVAAGDSAAAQVLRSAGEAAVRQAMRRHRDGGRLTDDEVAWLSLLLLHLPVRDYAWERISDDHWHITLWSDVTRRAQPDLVAPPASLLAFAAWRAGQGPLASVAVEQALRGDPDYSMARLIDEALRDGVPPSTLDDWGPGRGDRRRDQA